MTKRRSTSLILFFLVFTAAVGLPSLVYAAPPQFNPYWTYTSTVFSPFPGFEPTFISSITPTQFVPLVKLQRGTLYDLAFDYPAYSVIYSRRIKGEMMMVPVTSDMDKFIDRRIELSLANMSSDIGKESLMKDQKNKAGGLFQLTIPIPSRAFESIFGEGGAGLRVSGYRKISFSGRSTWTDKQETAFNRQSKFPVLEMDQVYRFDIEGTIGSKISVKVSQDSRNDIPLANRLILRYNGGEDDILQTVEAGNTTLNLPATQFLAYSTRVQGLFGIKATAQLADVSITAIASQEKGSTETIEISAGTSTMATTVIRDINYKKQTIYDLGRMDSLYLPRARSDTLPEPEKIDFFPGDSILSISVYLDDWNHDENIRLVRTKGICYVDPEDTTSDDPRSEYRTEGFFELVEEVDYFVNTGFTQSTPYIQFLRSVVGSDDVIGVFMVIKRATGAIDTIGDISQEPLRLKLIKPKYYPTANHHVWEYEWKNVYPLNATNINLQELDVKIYKGAPINNQAVNYNDPDNQEGTPYLQILGLDQGDNNATQGTVPDNEIDRTVHVDPVLGLLFFPSRHPFDSRFSFVNDPNSGEPVYLKDSVPEIYVSTSSTTQQAARYYIAISTQQRGSSTINLNATNIIDGSEVITSGGKRLSRGTDYEIDYDFGRLTILKDDPDLSSDLSIMFETAPFFSLARKTLLGTRLEYAPHRDFRLGTTILYKSDKSTSRKPKVGEETSKIFVWDADFNYRMENPLFTTLANAVPFVSATAKSYMQLAAEVARSYPNPNVDGEVFVDDFEGSKDSYSLGILRTNWRKASQPITIDTSLSTRGRIGWYNPLEQTPITEIWTNRDIGTGETDATMTMTIAFRPEKYKFFQNVEDNTLDTVGTIDPTNSWAGFMRNIPTGVAQQLENAQLLEIRLRGDTGVMHIDLGRITEDIDGNGMRNDEDKDGLRILDDDEDVGLDGLPSPLEFGYDPITNPDPAGDDFFYDKDNINVWRINGTEGNRDDPDGGYVPDSEDADNDGFEITNSYFSYRVDLSNEEEFYEGFYLPDSRNQAGWRTIRIPLRDPRAIDTMINDPTWTNIWFARIWFDSVDAEFLHDSITVEIASIEMLSTTWADSFVVADSQRSGQVSFDVAVINSEIDSSYRSPEGVVGSTDQATDFTETEQSLMMSFDGLNAALEVYSPDSGIVLAADTGLAVRKFYRAMNFMGYGKLQAYVHGDIDPSANTSDSVLFFFRMGYDNFAYYEYRTVIKPGWHPGNHVLIDFNEITGIKAKLLEDRKKGTDSSLVRMEKGSKYLVYIKPSGQDPTLTRIQYFSMGVVNLDRTKPAKGEVWIDELRLTDVRDDVGMAARFGINGNMSDLITYNFGYSTQDAYYRGVSSATKGGAANNLGSGQTKTNYNFSGSVNLEKFFPRSLEVSLPLSVSWSQSVQEPLLRSGTDIVVPEELKNVETSVSVNRGFRISEKFNKKTKNPLFTLLLNRFSSSFNYNISKGHSPTQPMFMSERYDAKASFNMSVRKPPTVTPFSWTAPLKIPFGFSKTRMYLYPTRLDFSGSLSGSYSESINQNNANPSSFKLDFRGGMNMQFNLIESLSGSYSFSTNRDLRDPKTVLLTFNPKKFKLGVEQNYNQNLRTNYNPVLFKFLTHKFDYSASYGDTYRTGRDSTFFHSATSKVSSNANLTFKHQDLIGSNKPSRGRGRNQEPVDDSTSSSGGFNILSLPVWGIREISDAIKPVSGKIGVSRSLSYPGLADKAAIPFRLGLTDDPGVPTVNATSTTIRASKSVTKSLTATSGVALFAGISVDVGYGRNTRETFDATPTKTISESWPDLKFNLRSIKGLWYLGKVLNALSPSSRYSRSKDTKRKTTAPYPNSINKQEAFAPLISFTLNPLRSMRTTVRYETNTNTAIQISETSGQTTNTTKRTANNFSFSWTYSFRNPSGVRLPLFGRIKFESNLSVTLDVSYRKSKAEAANSNTNYEFQLSEDKTSLSIRPSANYSFSSTVKGGLSGRWQDSNDLRTRRKTHTRELGIWVELRF